VGRSPYGTKYIIAVGLTTPNGVSAEVRTVWIVEVDDARPCLVTAYPASRTWRDEMIRELDTVVLAHDIDEYGLKCGDIGAVVHRYSDAPAFEVEFVTGEGETIAVLTLTRDDIRPIGHKEILHVRELVQA